MVLIKKFLSRIVFIKTGSKKIKIKILVHTSASYIGGKIGRVIIRSEDVFRNEIIIDF